MRTSSRSWSVAFALAGAAMFTGCVNTTDRFEEFVTRVGDGGAGVDAVTGEVSNVGGRFFAGMEAVIAQGKIFELAVDIDYAEQPDGTGLMSWSVQPLAVNTRELVGDPLVAQDVAVALDGTFEMSLNGGVGGDANPVSGSDIVLDITIIGATLNADGLCGEVNGSITEPFAAAIDGSTLGAIRIASDADLFRLDPPPPTCNALIDLQSAE